MSDEVRMEVVVSRGIQSNSTRMTRWIITGHGILDVVP
jgi:hypothetical protein